jgi:GNAT superfamily N-acetyltransferase
MRPIPRQRDTFAYRIAAVPALEQVFDEMDASGMSDDYNNAMALTDRLKGEFDEWAVKSQKTLHPYESSTDDDKRGPIGHWPYIEQFLNENYPAAFRGHEYGHEEARGLLDRDDPPLEPEHGTYWRSGPYATGPEAVNSLGYDPKEVAAGMLYLHNRSHSGRVDPGWLDWDTTRLTDIFDKRVKMQKAYDERMKTAAPALEQNAMTLVDRLQGEFDKWAKGVGAWKPDRGAIGHWPHVESFMRENYPAAYRGLEYGVEEARHLLNEDGRFKNTTPYSTGPEAIAEHGYDPKEIAAGMLYLHNRSHPGRVDPGWVAMDTNRLTDIAKKRHQMQKAYDERQMQRSAAVADDTIERLRGEFHDWWNADNGTSPKEGQPRWTPVSSRDAMGYWGNMERFLSARYPAASRDVLYMGMEQVEPLLHQRDNQWGAVPRNADPYETGPQAIEKHGYDPAEIAAGVLYLHNDGRPGREQFQHVYRNLILKIIRNRRKMQKEYDSKPRQLELPLDDVLDKAAAALDFASRLAMPAEDAYDGNWKSRKTSPPIVGPFYHSSDHDLPDGTILLPHHGESKFTDDYERRPGWKERTKWVWMELDPSGGWGEHTYEVEPMDEGPWPWNGDGRANGYTSPRARIIRKMTPEDQQELMDAFVDRMHEENRQRSQNRPRQVRLYTRTAMPAPLPEGITFHHHPDDSTIPAEHYDDFYAPAIEARHHGNYVGHLSWTDGSPEDGGRPVGEINGIMVKPEYQRHGVATAMFDYVRQQHEPAVHHSGFLSADGRSWRDYEESRHKTAMPAPLPDDVTFKYHHTNDSIPEGYSGVNQGGSHTFLAPAVAAYRNDKPIAYVEWWPTDKYPNAAKHYRHVMDKGKPGEVYYIYVHPNHRRNSIASEMFRWAKDNVEPDLHHSPKKSELGKKWVSYEESTPELARAAAVIRYAQRVVAMPLNHIPPMNHFDDRLFKKQLDNLHYYGDEITGKPDRANLIRSQGGSTINTAGEHAVFVSFIHHDENGAPTGILHYFPTGSRSAKEKPGGIQVLVHPDHQGKGIGSKLLDAAMAEYGPEAEGFGDYVPIDLDNQNVTPGGNALIQRYLKRTAMPQAWWEMETKNKGYVKGRYYSELNRSRDNLVKKLYGPGHTYQRAPYQWEEGYDSRYIGHIIDPEGQIVDHITYHGPVF